jgi:murein DD-endopeptidase MepM/ murein hydrolase activator NlpD
MRLKYAPLKNLRLTQPFGVNYVYPGFYSKVGLPKDKHNGLDYSSNGEEIYAVDDGRAVSEGSYNSGYGLHLRLWVPVDKETKLEVVYGHLKSVSKTGDVKAGDILGITDNSGYSTGPHLHFAVRRMHNGVYPDYDNGYLGYIDPAPLLPGQVDELPVDRRYGQSETLAGRVAFAPSFLWFIRTFRRAPSTREYNALRFGFYPVRTVLDPGMFPVWSEMTFPEAIKRGILNKPT